MPSVIQADQLKSGNGNTTYLNSGTLSNLTFPAGHVIQTVQNTYNSSNSVGHTSTTHTRFTITDGSMPFTGQITNVKANSHVYITMSYTIGIYKTNVSDIGVGCGIFRESSAIDTPGVYNNYYYTNDGAMTRQLYLPFCRTFIDTSPATGTNNYYASARAYNTASATIISDSSNLPFVCILQEVAQ